MGSSPWVFTKYLCIYVCVRALASCSIAHILFLSSNFLASLSSCNSLLLFLYWYHFEYSMWNTGRSYFVFRMNLIQLPLTLKHVSHKPSAKFCFCWQEQCSRPNSQTRKLVDAHKNWQCVSKWWWQADLRCQVVRVEGVRKAAFMQRQQLGAYLAKPRVCYVLHLPPSHMGRRMLEAQVWESMEVNGSRWKSMRFLTSNNIFGAKHSLLPSVYTDVEFLHVVLNHITSTNVPHQWINSTISTPFNPSMCLHTHWLIERLKSASFIKYFGSHNSQLFLIQKKNY